MAIIYVSDVEARLVQLGVPFSQTESNSIQFSIDKLTNFIKQETNNNEIPDQAKEVAIEMVISDFILLKIAFGLFDPGDVLPVAEAPIKSVKDGDTTVTYAVSDVAPETTTYSFENLAKEWAHTDFDWSSWRKLRW